MKATLTWWGHSNFLLRQKHCSILIDPFFTDNPATEVDWKTLPPPDIVLVTHLHHDHVGDAIDICRETKARLGVAAGTADRLLQRGVPEGLLLNGKNFNIGGTVLEKGARITMTEAMHSTDGEIPTGFIITMPSGVTVYHAGDTGLFANMALWGTIYKIDVALLPIGGVFTMDASLAARAARMLRARKVVPMHWGSFPTLAQDTKCFRQELKRNAPASRMLEMKPGQEIVLS